MYSSACIRPREEVQHRSGHGLRGIESCIRPLVFVRVKIVQDRSGHSLRGVQPRIRPLVFVRVKKCNTEVDMG